VATVISLQQDCDLATWGVDFAALEWCAGELGVSIERCPARTAADPCAAERFPWGAAGAALLLACRW